MPTSSSHIFTDILVSTEKIKSGTKSLYNALHPYVCPVAFRLFRSNPLREGPLPIQYALPLGTALTLSSKNPVSCIRSPLRIIVFKIIVSPAYGVHSMGVISGFPDNVIVFI